MGVLYCFGGGAARREAIQVNFPCGFAARENPSRAKKKYLGHIRIPPATQARGDSVGFQLPHPSSYDHSYLVVSVRTLKVKLIKLI